MAIFCQHDRPLQQEIKTPSACSPRISGTAWTFWFLAFSLLTGSALADTDVQILPPDFSTIDINHVDFASAQPIVDLPGVRIGTSAMPLYYTVKVKGERLGGGASSEDNLRGYISYANRPSDMTQSTWDYYGCQSAKKVQAGGTTEIFCSVNGVFVQIRASGSTLVQNADGTFVYTKKDGSVLTYAPGGPLVSIRTPAGLTTVLNYSSTTSGNLQSVTRNDGLQLKFNYVTDTSNGNHFLITVNAINNAVDYCDPVADSCTFSKAWPQATYNWEVQNLVPPTQFQPNMTHTLTDQSGGVTRITMGAPFGDLGSYLVGYKAPSSTSADTITYQYCRDLQGRRYLCGALRDGALWAYQVVIYPAVYDYRTEINSTSPTNAKTVLLTNMGLSMAPLSAIQTVDGISYGYDSAPSNRLMFAKHPEGDFTAYTYDARGNITAATINPKPGSGLVALPPRTAGYDNPCIYPAKCNKPNWVRDALGNQTDFTYDINHGGVLSETSPADKHGIRPQKRYSYTQRYAWFKNASGAMARANSPIWLLNQESYCKSAAAPACIGTTDEVVTTYDYGPDAGPNNLFLRGITITADGVTRRTCYAYDVLGNKISETTPNAGLASCQ